MSVAVPALITGLAMLVLWFGVGRSTDAPTGPTAPVPSLGPGTRPPDIPIASVGQLQLRLPVDPEKVTAILFHAVDNTDAVPLAPLGPLRWDESPDAGRRGPSRGGVDVGARAGTVVFSPVDGRVLSVAAYVVRGQPAGYQIVISPTRALGLAVVISHIQQRLDTPLPPVGKVVKVGERLGEVADLSKVVDQEISAYSADSGNHVAIVVVRLKNP